MSVNHKLLTACKNGNIGDIKLLLKSKADINWLGGNPLFIAGSNIHMRAVKLLLKSKADINVNNDFVFLSLVMDKKPDYELLKFLLDSGSNIDAGNGHALQCSVRSNNIDTVEFLLSEGADPNLKIFHSTALSIAIDRGHEEIVKLLIDYKVHIDTWTLAG